MVDESLVCNNTINPVGSFLNVHSPIQASILRRSVAYLDLTGTGIHIRTKIHSVDNLDAILPDLTTEDSQQLVSWSSN